MSYSYNDQLLELRQRGVFGYSKSGNCMFAIKKLRTEWSWN